MLKIISFPAAVKKFLENGVLGGFPERSASTEYEAGEMRE